MATAKGKLEALLSADVALYDVVAELPLHASKRYAKRDPSAIRRIFIHKSGANGAPGFAGILGSARYFVQSYGGTGGPGFAYTYWISQIPDRDAEDRIVVYRGNHDHTRSWHTGGECNGVGVGVACQGAFDGEGDEIEIKPSAAQLKALDALIPWLALRHGLDLSHADDEGTWCLSGHWENGKPVCPGDALRDWVQTRRGEPRPEVAPREPAPGEVDPWKFSVHEKRRALMWLGYLPANGTDPAWTYEERAALERFQRDARLKVDGWWGPKTSGAVLAGLRKANRAGPVQFGEALV